MGLILGHNHQGPSKSERLRIGRRPRDITFVDRSQILLRLRLKMLLKNFVYFTLAPLALCAMSPRATFSHRIRQVGQSIRLIVGMGLQVPLIARAAHSLTTEVDEIELRRVVNSGRVFICDDFVSPVVLEALQSDLIKAEKEGLFTVSGLSNGAATQQQFSRAKDRAIAPVLGGGYSSLPLQGTANSLGQLRRRLAKTLNRPTMSDESLAHEMYYSISPPGAGLPRHLDERHEELKGRTGYLAKSRRSLSWLLYLSDRQWDSSVDGGQLRTFPIAAAVTNGVGGAHDGNLQVGWLVEEENGEPSPVFLDAMHEPGPACVLYTLVGRQKRSSISCAFDLQALAQSRASISQAFYDALLPGLRRDRFLLIEEPDRWKAGEWPAGSNVEDVNPSGGRLVVFDSVLLPHEVQAVAQGARGRRQALAGWWHEKV